MIPLDLTHKVLATQQVQHDLLNGRPGSTIQQAPGSPTLRQLFHEILLFFAKTYSEVFGLIDGPPLHDPIAVVVLLDGIEGHHIFNDSSSTQWGVEVVTDGSHSSEESEHGRLGRTIIKRPDDLQHRGVRIPREIHLAHFWATVESCMQRAEEALSSPFNGGAQDSQ